MRYEWDERKDRENQRKHGVSFEVASRVFEDENRLILLDRVDEAGEQRWLAIGAVPTPSGAQAILIVAHAYRYDDEDTSTESRREDHDGEEIIRIISARAAGKSEVGRYREQAVD